MFHLPIIYWLKRNLFIFYSVLFVLLRLPMLGVPLERDEGAYAYIGWIWLNGLGIPYLDAYEMKPPLLHFIYMFPTLFFGNSYFGVRLFSIFWGLATLYVFWLFLRKIGNRGGLVLAAFAFLVGACNYPSQAAGFNAEAVQLLPLVAFLYYALKIVNEDKGWFMWGLMAGCAVLIKQTAFVPLLLIGLYIVVTRRSPVGLFKAIAGAGLIAGVFVVYFISQGAYGALVTHIFEYARLSTIDGYARIFCDNGQIGTKCLTDWLFNFKVVSVGILLCIAIAGYLLRIKARSTEWWLGLLYTIGTFLVIKMAGWKDWPHYYLLFTPGIALGIWHLTLITRNWWKWVLRLVYVLLFLVLIFNVSVGWEGARKILFIEYGSNDDQIFWQAPELAVWLQARVKPGEKLMVINDEAEIYYYAKIVNQTHYGYYYLFALKPQGKEMRDWLRQQEEHPPDYVVATEGGAMWNVNDIWHEYERRHPYHAVKQFGVFTVYQRG